MKNLYLTAPQMKAELEKCLQCPTKPCLKACPVSCSPHDFIALAKNNDWKAAANSIYQQNPLGEVCGLICPDTFCMHACVRKNLDSAIKIPNVQALIMKKARETNSLSADKIAPNGRKVAVIGLGPAGIGAVSELLKQGFSVDAFEKEAKVGGALNLIPQNRLPRDIIKYEWSLLAQNPLLTTHFNNECVDFEKLTESYFAVIAACGTPRIRTLGIKGEELMISYREYLANPEKYASAGNVAIIGGGAVAVDCVTTAHRLGATQVEMFVRRRIGDMKITPNERAELAECHTDITTMTRIDEIIKEGKTLTAYTIKTRFNADGKLEDIPQTRIARPGFSLVISALGSDYTDIKPENERIFYAGDMQHGASTAVQAIASGKNAAAKVTALLS